jgi:mannopine transport system ATP-binding protein
MFAPDATFSQSDGRALGVSSHSVSFNSITKRYGATLAVDNVSIDVRAGEFVSLLGPSGSGKTSLLMMLAGFEQPTQGQILVNGVDITTLPPNRRNIGMVFQSYALFPHMTVGQNIAYPLRMRGMKRPDIQRRVAETLELVQLSGYGSRMPRQLSGGQQQRVALARAIVFSPEVILMDEPLGALDKKLREHLQFEIKQLQLRLGATVIYVTHDQGEALTMSDRIAVLDQGRLLQVGPPREVYQSPETPFVANFLGVMNFIIGMVVGIEGNACVIGYCGARVLAQRNGRHRRPSEGEFVKVGIRPEKVRVVKAPSGRSNALSGKVREVVFTGANVIVLVQIKCGDIIRADIMENFDAAPGDAVDVFWADNDAVIFSGSGT